MTGFLVFVVVVVLAVTAWKMRVPILAKILGQDQSRVQRQINRRRD
jgi:hypothetical protein